ncbi:MAG: DUF3500 domain-containing protein [Gemmataceae bacterium]
MRHPDKCCAECRPESGLNRRDFLQASAAAVLAGSLAPTASAKPGEKSETLTKTLYDSLDDKQKKVVCFDWDFKDRRGLLRTHISNNWRITPPAIKSDFFTKDQQALIRQIWEGIVNPDWIERFDRQFKDDMGGFAVRQSIALFGTPGTGKFEFVLSGRHGTVRCDGDSQEHVAFGGPIVYGHAASGYYEKPAHPDNVFWHQALAANDLFKMLDGKQRDQALLPEAPDEAEIGFRSKIDGIPIAELSKDQQKLAQEVLLKLIEPFRQSDRAEALAALKKQGGLEKCHLIFYKADDLGEDKIWDNWRLEGPAFVWHYRGAPHVHVWVNVADDASVDLNAKNLSGPLRQK